jgi:Uma2 family endonuclease
MADVVRRRASYADVLAAPPDRVAEVLDGELRVSPRPGGAHTAAASALGDELGPPFKRGRGGPGGWLIVDGPEIHLGEDILVPDLAGWRRERLPALPDAPYVALAPDWVCEVLSPSTVRIDRVEKMPIYARERVGFLWLVDPTARTLEVYELVEGRWVLAATHAENAGVRAVPFETVELELGVLWMDVARTTPD